jgi:hypothetical protein
MFSTIAVTFVETIGRQFVKALEDLEFVGHWRLRLDTVLSMSAVSHAFTRNQRAAGQQRVPRLSVLSAGERQGNLIKWLATQLSELGAPVIHKELTRRGFRR